MLLQTIDFYGRCLVVILKKVQARLGCPMKYIFSFIFIFSALDARLDTIEAERSKNA